jgi:hypothetical protein
MGERTTGWGGGGGGVGGCARSSCPIGPIEPEFPATASQASSVWVGSSSLTGLPMIRWTGRLSSLACGSELPTRSTRGCFDHSLQQGVVWDGHAIL